ncbi:MAG: peptidase T4, partial [Jannaschia sp.]
PMDGDLVFAAATGERALADPVWDALRLGHAAASCLARAIARGVHGAAAGGALSSFGERFGGD